MAEDGYTIFNKDINDERIVNDIFQFVRTKEVAVNIINENIAASTVINNVTVSLSKSFEFQNLLERLSDLEDSLSYIPAENTAKRFEIGAKITHQTEHLKRYMQDVLELARELNRIEINTERKRQAKEYFDRGEFDKARAVLDFNELRAEQEKILARSEEIEQAREEILRQRQNNSEEFYLRALVTQFDYRNREWYAETCLAFEASIKSLTTRDNLFMYALFLQKHNKQFSKAVDYYNRFLNEFSAGITLDDKVGTLNNLAYLHSLQHDHEAALRIYQEALKLNRRSVKVEPETYRPHLAMNLNNLGILYEKQADYEKALRVYKEALKIRRELAGANSAHLRDVAATLNNLGIIYWRQNKYDKALRHFTEALGVFYGLVQTDENTYAPDAASTINNLGLVYAEQGDHEKSLSAHETALDIYRSFAEINPYTFLPDVAMTLNNLGNAYKDLNNHQEAVKRYAESLRIRRELAEAAPEVYLPEVAIALNNLGVSNSALNNHETAVKEYKEALRIRRKLFNRMPLEYGADLASTLVNLANYFQDAKPHRAKSILYAIEAMIILLAIYNTVTYAQKFLPPAVAVLKNWNFRDDELTQLIKDLQVPDFSSRTIRPLIVKKIKENRSDAESSARRAE